MSSRDLGTAVLFAALGQYGLTCAITSAQCSLYHNKPKLTGQWLIPHNVISGIDVTAGLQNCLAD
jgi:hypothetical protein